MSQPRAVRRRARELGSGKRAGVWLRQQALQRQRQTIRNNWVVLAAAVAGGLGLSATLLLLPRPEGLIAFGAAASSVLWAIGWVVVLASGSTSWLQGDLGEQWTQGELAPLRRKGYRIVHHFQLKGDADLDHVVIGPPGVVVVETKGGGTDWNQRREEARVGEAVMRVKERSRSMRLWLLREFPAAPVAGAVALWPARDSMGSYTRDDVTILPGTELRRWIEDLPSRSLSPADVEAIWQKIDRQVALRDSDNERRFGPPLRTFDEILIDAVQVPIGLMGGLLAAGLAFAHLGWPYGWLATIAGTVAAIRASSVRPVRWFLAGVSVGLGITSSWVLIALALHYLGLYR